MNENNQYVVTESVNNEPKKKKINAVLWCAVVVIVSLIITFALKGYSSSLASEGEAAIPFATFIDSIATLLPFVLIPGGIALVVIIASIKNKK